MAITNSFCAPVQEYAISSQRLCIPFAVVHSATPALKTQSNALGAAMILALEGQTAAAAAIDSGTSFATPTDSTGTFGILLYNLGTVGACLKASVDSVAAGVYTAKVTTLEGASNSGVTASANIAVSVTGFASLATTDAAGVLSVDYQLSS